MKASQLEFKIAQLRQENLYTAVQSVAIFVFSFVGTAFVPDLLIRYVIKATSMDQVPPTFEYLPVVFVLIGIVYFVYALLSTLARAAQIRRLTKELDMLPADDCCGNCEHDMGMCCVNCQGNCQCDDHSNCMCGCGMNSMTQEDADEGDIMVEMDEPKKVSTKDMAATMKAMNSKKSKSKKK